MDRKVDQIGDGRELEPLFIAVQIDRKFVRYQRRGSPIAPQADPIEGNLDLIRLYKALGVGVIQLTYNVRNRVGDGCEEPTDAGLSRFGQVNRSTSTRPPAADPDRRGCNR